MELDCALTPAPEMVVLRELEMASVSEGGFYIAEHAMGNSRSGFYKVEAVGSIAHEKSGLNAGDHVFADRLASHYHTTPVCVMKWNNVFLITDAEKTRYESMPGWALLTEIDDSDKSTFIVNDSARIKHGLVKSINYGDMDPKDCPFKVGDDVMITKNCDILDGFGGEKLIAMKIEDVIARFDHAED